MFSFITVILLGFILFGITVGTNILAFIGLFLVYKNNRCRCLFWLLPIAYFFIICGVTANSRYLAQCIPFMLPLAAYCIMRTKQKFLL
jgi:hypothetical protein